MLSLNPLKPGQVKVPLTHQPLNFLGQAKLTSYNFLKPLEKDVFQKSVSFGSKNKKPRELFYEGKKFKPDGRITQEKKGLYQLTLEKTINPILNPAEQDALRAFLVDRTPGKDKYTLGKDGLPEFPVMSVIGSKLFDHAMSLEHQDPDRVAFLFMKDEIVKSPEYREIQNKNPYIQDSKVYFPDGVSTAEKIELARVVMETIRAELEEKNAELFKKVFIDSQIQSLTPEECVNLYQALTGLCYGSGQEKLFKFFSGELKASKVYSQKEQEYYDECNRRYESIEKAREEGDVDRYYSLIDKQNKQMVDDFDWFISSKSLEKYNVWLRLAPEITGVEFIKDMYDTIAMYSELGMPLPNEINANYEKTFENKDPNAKVITLGNYQFAYNMEDNKVVYTSIHINKDMFSNKYKKDHKDAIHDIFRTFYHEVGHHLHAMNDPKKFMSGLENILDKDEHQVFERFVKVYQENYPEIKGLASKGAGIFAAPAISCFNTREAHDNSTTGHQNMIYNMTVLESNWNNILKVLEDRDSLSEKLKGELPQDYLDKVKPVMQKLVDAVNLIKHHLPGDSYALCNSAETVAEASMEELDGHYLEREFRELLYKLGKPKAKNMSYLDEHREAG